MSLYRKGARFENTVKKHLEKHGYFVIRSAGSKGPADLIAIKKPRLRKVKVWLIQCKLHGALPKDERKKLVKLARRLHLTPVLASKKNRRIAFDTLR